MAEVNVKDRINVLITLYRGYGMGDAVQMSAVLRHLRKYRPEWRIDFQAQAGRWCIGRGIVENVFSYEDRYPTPYYDGETQIILYDKYWAWGDRPETRVSSCLRDRFGLAWDESCGRYQVQVTEIADHNASIITPRRAVALHYQGDSAADRKNLAHATASEICDAIMDASRYPLLLDWRDNCPIANRSRVYSVGKWKEASLWGGDAEMNCAVIRRCDAFIGIDSGPSKCASATTTPSLVVWTKHHPALFHDPAPNTTHLVPVDFHSLHPVCNNPDVVKFFDSHYSVRTYKDSPVPAIRRWLSEVL